MKVINTFIDKLSVRSEKKLVYEILGKNIITYVDIGAAGGIKPRWYHYTQKINYICFEPNKSRATELHEIHKNEFNGMCVHDSLCWDKDGNIDFFITHGPNECSALMPNQHFVKDFLSPERFRIEQVVNLKSKKLDSVMDNNIDFIKVDVQGGTGEFLSGADKALNFALGLEIEVEFFEVYQNQSLFQDVRAALEKKGYIFEDFTELCRWNRKNRNQLGGRLIHADAFFIKDPELMVATAKTDYEHFKKYLAILLIYRRYDLISYCIDKASMPIEDKRKFLSKLYKIAKKVNLKLKLAGKVSRLIGPGVVNYPSG